MKDRDQQAVYLVATQFVHDIEQRSVERYMSEAVVGREVRDKRGSDGFSCHKLGANGLDTSSHVL